MTNESGPTWLRLGGLLSGIAALLTAVLAAVATFVDLWPGQIAEPTKVVTDPGEAEPTPRDISSGSSVTAGTSLSRPSEGTADFGRAADEVTLARYDADGCFYAVTVLEPGEQTVRVRFFPFNLATFVATQDIRRATVSMIHRRFTATWRSSCQESVWTRGLNATNSTSWQLSMTS